MKNILSVLLSVATLGLANIAVAGPQCTTEPKSKWVDTKAFKNELQTQGYKIKVFKITKGNCYEIYGWNKDKKRVEIYFNPTNKQIVKAEIDN